MRPAFTTAFRAFPPALAAVSVLLTAAPSAVALPADPPDGMAAVDFVSSLSRLASRLDDETLLPATSVFLKDAASFGRAKRLGPALFRQMLGQKFSWVSRKGFRYTLIPAGPVADGLPAAIIVFYSGEAFRIDLAASFRFKPEQAPDPDPRNHFPSLKESLVGVVGEGPLAAIFNFGPGAEVRCTLLPDEAPRTVAAFVALARGLRSVRITRAPDGGGEVQVDWVKRPWYDGSGGLPVLDRRAVRLGSDDSPGFSIPDEISVSRRHDAPALLTTLPGSPDAWEGAIAITAAPVPAHDDVGTIFGLCDPVAVEKLSRAWRLRKGEYSIPALLGVRIVKE